METQHTNTQLANSMQYEKSMLDAQRINWDIDEDVIR